MNTKMLMLTLFLFVGCEKTAKAPDQTCLGDDLSRARNILMEEIDRKIKGATDKQISSSLYAGDISNSASGIRIDDAIEYQNDNGTKKCQVLFTVIGASNESQVLKIQANGDAFTQLSYKTGRFSYDKIVSENGNLYVMNEDFSAAEKAISERVTLYFADDAWGRLQMKRFGEGKTSEELREMRHVFLDPQGEPRQAFFDFIKKK